jgi:hypothetical protein
MDFQTAQDVRVSKFIYSEGFCSGMYTLKPCDIILTRLTVPILKQGTFLATGSFIAHTFIVLDTRLITASIFRNMEILERDFLDNYDYFHVYRLKPELAGDKEKIRKRLLHYYKRRLKYNPANVIGHLLFTVAKNARLAAGQHKDISKPCFLYNPNEITCSQILFRAICESIGKKRIDSFYKAIGNEDIRSFFPTKIPLIADYRYTVFPKTMQRRALEIKERNKLDRKMIL